MRYTGRITLTVVVMALFATVRIYGYLYYDVSLMQPPAAGLVAILICWWFGRQYDKLKFYSEKDVLTGIYNRRYVLQSFPKLLEQMAKRRESLTLFLIDADKFKTINDTHGHETGDKVLRYISKALLNSAAKKDIVARWAGDEFLIISPSSDEKTGECVKTLIRQALEQASQELHIPVSVSVGAAVFPQDATTLDALLHAADCEMYAMKARRVLPDRPQTTL